MLISKTHSVSTDPTGTIARQAADKKQLTTQEIKTLAPQIGDTLIEANGKEITLTADNFAAVTAANTKDFFVSKQDGTYYFKNDKGIDILSDGGKYTDNTDDDMASIKYSPAARDAWKASMHGDGNKDSRQC